MLAFDTPVVLLLCFEDSGLALTLTFMQGLREHSVVLMGKNTLMKRCIRLYAERTQEEKWNVLLDVLVGNVGIIFTNVSIRSRQRILRFF